jgi:hypothetical protein
VQVRPNLGAAPMPETPIVFDDVKMLNASSLGRTFRIGGKDVFVGSAVSLEGTTVVVIGQVGRLVLPRWFVEQEHIAGGRLLQ